MERSADWMAQAHADLDHARYALEGEFYEWACFSSQQAAEKASKAVFQKMGGEAWGHSVSDLLEALPEEHEIPEDLVGAALELDKAYIPTRYPDAHQSGALTEQRHLGCPVKEEVVLHCTPRSRYTQTEANRLVHHAERILQFCDDLLSAV